MARVRPLDAAFEGFRIVRDRPQLILAWTGFYFLSFLALIGVMLAALWLQPPAQGAGIGFGEDQLTYLTRRFGFVLLVVLPIALAMVSVVPAAITRSVVRPGDGQRSYIRLSGDELRLLLLQFIFPLLILILGTAYDWLVGRVFDFSGPLAWLVPGLAVVVSAVLWLWLFLRLCLLVAVTVAEQRIRVADAWRVTKGQVVPLAIMWLIVLAGIVGVTLLSAGASVLIASVTGGFRVFGEISQSDLTGISRGDAIRALIELLVQFATGALWLVMCFTLVYAAAARACLTLLPTVAPDP